MLQKLKFSPFSLSSLPEGQGDSTKGEDKSDADDEDILFGMHDLVQQTLVF